MIQIIILPAIVFDTARRQRVCRAPAGMADSSRVAPCLPGEKHEFIGPGIDIRQCRRAAAGSGARARRVGLTPGMSAEAPGLPADAPRDAVIGAG